jgi:hypothetical protein
MEFSLVLEDSFVQIAGHADIESVAPAGYDVSEVVAFAHGENHTSGFAEKQTQVLRLPATSLRSVYGRSG